MSRRTITSFEHALLGLLLRRPRSGYDLRQVFATTPLGGYSDSTGAVYPALKRLEAARLISGRVDDSTPLRPRKLYRLTRAGRETLLAWMTSPVTDAMIERASPELDLRLAFCDQVLDDAQVAEFLRDWRDAQHRYVTKLVAYLDDHATTLTGTGRAALELGLAQQRARLKWLRAATRARTLETAS